MSQTMPTDLSMWDINPKTGATPLTITWAAYLNIAGYTPIYPFLNGEYLQLQVSMGNGKWVDWVDILGAATQTSHNSSNGYEGYVTGTYTIPTTWPPGTYQFRLLYLGSTTKGLATSTSPTIAITITGGSGSNKTTKYIVAAAVAIGVIALIGVAASK